MAMQRRMAGLLAVCLSVCLFTGCRVGNTELVWRADEMTPHRSVLEVNERECSLKLAKLYLCNYRNLYGNAYGIDLWKSGYEEAALEQYVKDVTLQEVFKIACMNLLAEQREMSLTAEEQTLAYEAAEEYYDSLAEAEIIYMDIGKNDVARAYREYALAKKLYDSLTEGIDEEVSDDEARVIRVQQIYVPDVANANKVQEKLEAGDDFAAVASVYNRFGEIERNIARDEYPQEVENIAFNLDNNAVSECIETEEGYYFVKCLSKMEEELTEENKENIRKKRRMQKFNGAYEEFLKQAEYTVNTELWDGVSLKGTEKITTDSFFDVYNKYFHK